MALTGGQGGCMPANTGFDNEKYLAEQRVAILERLDRFNNKLYLEFGGKLLFDYHASRVLPGFDPNVKMKLLKSLKEKADILLCIYAGDIERKKVRADFGITYDADALKLIDDLDAWGIDITAVVITRYQDQPAARIFKERLERRSLAVYTHQFTKGYPIDVDTIVSDQGYGENPFLQTSHPLVVVTGPGPGSGKLATCLSQLYHHYRQGEEAGYAKFETFPIWNLPLKHPVNIAYESATADLKDYNEIDPFHLEAYGKSSVNYNRDVEAFPLLKRILQKISGHNDVYRSPTDMGVNRAGFAITDDEIVSIAAKQEIIRRYFVYSVEYAMGYVNEDTVERAELLMKELGLKPEDRTVVIPARLAAKKASDENKGHKGIFSGAAIELNDGTIITGHNSPLMHAASALLLNAIKHLAGIPDEIDLIGENVILSVGTLKKDILNQQNVSLNLEETLIALSISATTNPTASAAMSRLKSIAGCMMHTTHIPTPGDGSGLRKLGVNLTSDPDFSTKNLFTGK
jgi:uncharacterized protein (UPF0371 family)